MKVSFSSHAVSASSDIRIPAPGALGWIGTALHAAVARLDGWGKRRETAAALANLTERDLRDIGLVRFTDAGPTSYAHLEDRL